MTDLDVINKLKDAFDVPRNSDDNEFIEMTKSLMDSMGDLSITRQKQLVKDREKLLELLSGFVHAL